MKKYGQLILEISGLITLVISFFLPILPSSDSKNFLSLFDAFIDQDRLLTGIILVSFAFLYLVWRVLGLIIPDKLSSFGPYNRSPAHSARFIVSLLMIFAILNLLFDYGVKSSYFLSLPIIFYIQAILFMVIGTISLFLLSKRLGTRDPDFAAYMENQERKKNRLIRISSKLILLFVLIIAFIGSILTLNFANSYKTSIVKAVSDSAISQVEQAASTYKLNLEDSLALVDFLKNLNSLNKKSSYPFERFTFFSLDRKSILLKEKADNTFFSEFRTEFSSENPDLQFPPNGLGLDPKKVETWVKLGVSTQEYDAGVYQFISPIVKKEKVKTGDREESFTRVLGFAILKFREEVILEPFYLGLIRVIILSIFFLYLGVAIIYLAGNFLITPLLYLRMSVQETAQSLGRMIEGRERVAASLLNWKDKVQTRDEIKALSNDFGDMVTVLRGVIPYISASTLKQAQKGTASSTRKELCFLFTDIRGFTTLCEGLNPDEVVNVLNRYLDLETEIILECNGDVDKFVGDEMMAFFDGPDKEINACRAAIKIIKAMDNEALERSAKGLPIVEIGIGIHTGEVVFGSVGAKERMDFTSIGDVVNLSARLEGANKAYGTRCLISQNVYEKVRTKFLCREIDLLAVKGKEKPVSVFEILHDGPGFGIKEKELVGGFQKGLGHYRLREWSKALAYFKLIHERYNDPTALAYIERIEHFKKEAPSENWDGVFRLSIK